MVHGRHHFHFFFPFRCYFFSPLSVQPTNSSCCAITLYRVSNDCATPRLFPFSINLLISFDCITFFFYVFGLRLDESVMSPMLPSCHHQFRFFLLSLFLWGRKCFSWPGRRTTPIVCCGQIKKKTRSVHQSDDDNLLALDFYMCSVTYSAVSVYWCHTRIHL